MIESARVVITGWKAGLGKVHMTNFIKKYSGIGLAASKNCTDRLLDGETVVVTVSDIAVASLLSASLNEIGAISHIEHG